MNKKYFLPVLLFILVQSSCKKEEAPKVNPIEVSVVSVLQQDANIESEYTGQTFGQSDIQINPRVDGVIESLNFSEGTQVKKGQLLYTIDPLPYQANVDKALADLSSSQARLAKAKSDFEMIEPLAKINAVSQRELISSQSIYKASISNIKASQASLENARIELGYCRILAPISGLIGISKVRVGDYVQPGSASVLNTISDLGDVRVRFTVSEQEFLRIFRELTKENSTLKDAGKSITLRLSDGTLYPQKGKVSFADRQIDPTTGAVTFEASFPNPDHLLRPGQYVKVGVVTDVRKNALIIPQRAVIEMQGIFQVLVLGEGNKVNMQIIKIGQKLKNAYTVDEGLNAGDKIVMGGSSILKNGSVVIPKTVDWKVESAYDDQSSTN